MNKFISQTCHNHLKKISCRFSSCINDNDSIHITRSGNVMSIRSNVMSIINIMNNTSSCKLKNYHIIDQQYRLYQSSRCILKDVETSKIDTTNGTASTIAAAETLSSGGSSSSSSTIPDNRSDTKSSADRILSENKGTLKSRKVLKDSDILAFPLAEENVQKVVRPDLGIITSNSWSCTRLRNMKEVIPDEVSDPDAKWVKITKELLNSTTPTVEKVANDFLSLDILELNQFFRLLERRMGLPKNFMFKSGGGDNDMMNAATAKAAAEPVKEKEFFDLKLNEVDAKAKIKIIKEVRAITSLGLKEAKEMVESIPVVLMKGLKKEEAEKMMKQLIDAGAKVELI